jgi:hypothetical protein
MSWWTIWYVCIPFGAVLGLLYARRNGEHLVYGVGGGILGGFLVADALFVLLFLVLPFL